MIDQSDTALVVRALAGNGSARRDLASRLIDPVEREVSRCLARWASATRRDAEQDVFDMVQDTLVYLFEHDARELRRWDPQRGRSLPSFVRLVARRRVAKILGSRRGNPWTDVPVDPSTLGEAASMDLSSRLEDRGHLDVLLGALYAQMSERDAELFELLFVEDREPAEVAQEMGMSRGAVNAWSYRMRKLARGLEDDLDGSLSSPGPESAKMRGSRA